jgi:hypothetical protein
VNPNDVQAITDRLDRLTERVSDLVDLFAYQVANLIVQGQTTLALAGGEAAVASVERAKRVGLRLNLRAVESPQKASAQAPPG